MLSDWTLCGIARWCVLWIILSMAPCMAQDAQPGGGAAACKVESPTLGASIVQASGESLQRKRWQPQGGVVQFTIRAFAALPENTSFHVCFRWRTQALERGGDK